MKASVEVKASTRALLKQSIATPLLQERYHTVCSRTVTQRTKYDINALHVSQLRLRTGSEAYRLFVKEAGHFPTFAGLGFAQVPVHQEEKRGALFWYVTK